MEIQRSGAQPSGKGSSDYFTGAVRHDPLFSPPGPARVSGALVTFEPGARTVWHTRDGGPIEEIRPGDVVWFPPSEKHWHGATATTAMSHIAVQEKLNGSAVDWLEPVTDEQYRK
jgi:quercetin dioxygenase-like cupin family protein